MLNKIELFKTRIFHENKTYLLVSDAAKALGYVSTADFMDKYSELIVFIEQMPKLISETDFNWLLSNDNRVWQLLRSSQQLFLRLLVYEANPEKQCRQNLLTS